MGAMFNRNLINGFGFLRVENYNNFPVIPASSSGRSISALLVGVKKYESN